MLSRFIHLLLIPVILGCPLLCGVGSGASSSGCCEVVQQPATCCAGCPADADGSTESVPNRDGEPADHSCQCVCGGAVLADGLQTDEPLALSLGWNPVLGDLPAAMLTATEVSPTAGWFLLRADVGATPGRLVRCLHRSLLL